jgi:uncharacterized membrane protein YkoI
MDRKAKLLVGGALTMALVAGGTGVAVAAGGGGDAETPITGRALAAASAAALAHAGGGRVTETEAGDEGGFYEVEVTREDGSQVDVHLDRDFHVLGSKADHERSR